VPVNRDKVTRSAPQNWPNTPSSRRRMGFSVQQRWVGGPAWDGSEQLSVRTATPGPLLCNSRGLPIRYDMHRRIRRGKPSARTTNLVYKSVVIRLPENRLKRLL